MAKRYVANDGRVLVVLLSPRSPVLHCGLQPANTFPKNYGPEDRCKLKEWTDVRTGIAVYFSGSFFAGHPLIDRSSILQDEIRLDVARSPRSLFPKRLGVDRGKLGEKTGMLIQLGELVPKVCLSNFVRTLTLHHHDLSNKRCPIVALNYPQSIPQILRTVSNRF